MKEKYLTPEFPSIVDSDTFYPTAGEDWIL